MNTLQQVRANNISQARITWLNELRKLLAEYINESARLAKELARVRANKLKGVKIDKEATAQFVRDLYKNMGRGFEVRLYLSKTDPTHIKLSQLIDAFYKVAAPSDDKKVMNKKVGEIIDQARIVLKQTWEEAKKEISAQTQ